MRTRTSIEQDNIFRKTRLFYIHKEIMPKLQRQWSELRRVKRETPSLSTYINQLILSSLEREEVLNKLLPNLNFVGIVQNVMVIQDTIIGKMYSVRRTDGELICDEDKADNCRHVRFALATSEITQLYTDFNLAGETQSDHRTVRQVILNHEKSENKSTKHTIPVIDRGVKSPQTSE